MWNYPQTPYQLLGLREQASREEVRSAHRKLASLNHPDREGGDAAKMSMINAAYDVLYDPAKRKEYDTFYKPKCARCKGTRSIKVMQGFKLIKKRCPDCA